MPTIEQSTDLFGAGAVDLTRQVILAGGFQVLAWGVNELSWGGGLLAWGGVPGLLGTATLISPGLVITRTTALT